MSLSTGRPAPRTLVRAGATMLLTAVAATAAGQEVISIDARGQAPRRATFGTRTIVTVHVVNKNPYLYRYRTSINEETVQETVPLMFVAQLSPLASAIAAPLAGGPGPSAAIGTAPPQPRLRPPDACPADDLAKASAALTWIDDQLKAVGMLERDALSATSALAQAYTAARGQIAQRRMAMLAPRATSSELDGAASAAKQATELYPKPSDVNAVEQRLRLVEAGAKSVSGAIDEYRTTFPACQPVLAGGNPLIPNRVYVDGLTSWWLEDKRAVIVAVRAGSEGLTTLTNAIDRARTEGAYEETHPIGNYTSPTRVTVSVRRWPIGDADDAHAEVVAVARLDFGGGARFLLSGGLGHVRGIRTREFFQTRGFERNEQNEPLNRELVPVIGVKRDTTTMLAPAVLLNTRLWRLPQNPIAQTLFGTMGITAAKSEQGTDVDYMLGASVGVLDDRVLFTGALYYGKEQRLSGDLSVGAKVADDFTDIPVTKSYGKGLGLFITYKIR